MLRWLRSDGIVLVGCVGFTMLLGWRLGQEVGWDLRNYHFYVPHLLLEDRFLRDLEPAGVQTYFNPLLDVPFYLAVAVWRWRPIVVGLAQAAFHGLGLWLVYRVAMLLFAGETAAWARAAALTATVTAACGAAFLTAAGSTSSDLVVAVLVLAALVCLLAAVERDGRAARRLAASAALIAGLATGCKLVAAMYAAGLFAATLLLPGEGRLRLLRAVRFGAFFLLGVLLTQGYWSWLMYRHHGSPFFPFLDAAGTSPYAAVDAYLRARFGPRDGVQTLLYPFFLSARQTLSGELPFRDARLALACVGIAAFVAVAATRLWRRGEALDGVRDARLLAFAGFFVTSFVAWEARSSIYRFAVALELSAAVLFVAAVAYCLRSTRAAVAVAAPLCLLVALWTRPPTGSLVRVPWSSSYFGVDEAVLAPYRDATILMASLPNAYVVPFFPPTTSFIRVSGTRNWRYVTQPRVRADIARRLRDVDRRSVYLLDLPPSSLAVQEPSLAFLGLRVDPNRCTAIASLFETGRLCRMAGAGPVGGSPREEPVPATYEGYHDVTNCNGITGWAWDAARPDLPLEIDVYDGVRLLARVVADQPREDLQRAGKGNGRHGFMLPTPGDLYDGVPHEIVMKYAATGASLGNGPLRITCDRR